MKVYCSRSDKARGGTPVFRKLFPQESMYAAIGPTKPEDPSRNIKFPNNLLPGSPQKGTSINQT